MDRREVLALAGGGLAAALAGCSGDDSDGQEPTPEAGTGENGSDDAAGTDDGTGTSTEPDDGTETSTEPDDGAGDDGEVGGGGIDADIPGEPLSTVEAYVAAVDSSDEEAALALLHEDSEQEPSDVSRDLEFFGGAEVVLLAHGIVEYDEPDVVARGIMEVTREEEGTSRIGLELTLRQGADDQWLIVDGRATRLADGEDDGSAALGGTGA